MTPQKAVSNIKNLIISTTESGSQDNCSLLAAYMVATVLECPGFLQVSWNVLENFDFFKIVLECPGIFIFLNIF